MSPVAFAIAALPVAMYLVLIGRLRVSRRPLVTTGWRDVAAIGIAIVGLVMIGPMQLFFPTTAAARFAGWVWLMLLALYLLSLFLVVLSCRPRLIVYGIDENRFYDSLVSAARNVDASAAWQGQVLNMPSVGLQLAAEPTGSRSVQQAVCLNGLTSVAPWLHLERELVKQCAQIVTSDRRWVGTALIVAGLVLALAAMFGIISNPAGAYQELRDLIVR